MLTTEPSAAPSTVPAAPKNDPTTALVAAAPAPAMTLLTVRSGLAGGSATGALGVAAAVPGPAPGRGGGPTGRGGGGGGARGGGAAPGGGRAGGGGGGGGAAGAAAQAAARSGGGTAGAAAWLLFAFGPATADPFLSAGDEQIDPGRSPIVMTFTPQTLLRRRMASGSGVDMASCDCADQADS